MTDANPHEALDERDVRQAYKLHGRVQGVGFRWWTRQQAARLGLRGTVRNCPDGSVDVLLVGPEARVSRMRELLNEGPRSARVDRVEERPAPEGPAPDSFQIVR